MMQCSSLLQVDIVPSEELDVAAMMQRVQQPMSGAMPGESFLRLLSSFDTALKAQSIAGAQMEVFTQLPGWNRKRPSVSHIAALAHVAQSCFRLQLSGSRL